MALKKESNSLGNENEKSQNENASLIELKNLEKNKEIESQKLEVSKDNDNENGFLKFGRIFILRFFLLTTMRVTFFF